RVLTSVVCTSSNFCTIVGFGPAGGLVLTLKNGKLGPVRKLPGGGSQVELACRSAEKCYAFGYKRPKNVIVPIDRGKPGRAQAIKPVIYGAFCTRKSCSAAGRSDTGIWFNNVG